MPMVPKGEKLEKPLSLAFTKEMLAELDKIGRETRNNRADTIRHLLRWAIDAYKRSRNEEEERAAGASPSA